MNTYRKLLADAIERNGGYHGGYHERFALAWNVKLHGVYMPDFHWAPVTKAGKAFFDLVQQSVKENFLGDEPLTLSADQKKMFETDWNSDSSRNVTWDTVTEDMRSSVTDDDTYRTWSPEVERRYGFKPDTLGYKLRRRKLQKREGVTDHGPDYFFNVKWGFAGRSGGYLVLEWFEGHNITMRNLADEIRGDETGTFSNEWCRKLLAMIDEWDSSFSRQNVKKEFEYQVAYRAASELFDLHEQHEKDVEEATEAQFWAERDVRTK